MGCEEMEREKKKKKRKDPLSMDGLKQGSPAGKKNSQLKISTRPH